MRKLLPQELLERDRGEEGIRRAPQRIPVSAPGLYSAGKEAAALAGIGRPSIEAVRLRQRTVCSGYFKHPSASHVRCCRPLARRYGQPSHGPDCALPAPSPRTFILFFSIFHVLLSLVILFPFRRNSRVSERLVSMQVEEA